MKFSRKVEVCGLSPVRKFYPYEVAAEAKGLKIRHLNIGQPDIETPDVFFDAIRNFEDKVIAYAPAPVRRSSWRPHGSTISALAAISAVTISWRRSAAARRCRLL